MRGLGWGWGAEPSRARLLPQGGWKVHIQCAQCLWGQKSWGQTSRSPGAGRETGDRSFTLRAVRLHPQSQDTVRLVYCTPDSSELLRAASETGTGGSQMSEGPI